MTRFGVTRLPGDGRSAVDEGVPARTGTSLDEVRGGGYACRVVALLELRVTPRGACSALLLLTACGGDARSEPSEPETERVFPGQRCPEDLPICPLGVVPIDGCICRQPPNCEEGAVRCVGPVSLRCGPQDWYSSEVCISAAMCIDSPPGGCITPEGTPPACRPGEFICPAMVSGCVPCTDGRWRQPPLER